VVDFRLTIMGNPAPWCVYIKRGEPPIGFQHMKVWQQQIQLALRVAWQGEPLSGPVVLDCEFYLPWSRLAPVRAKALQKWYWKHLAMKPDLDNLRKAFSDACEGILYHGDQQVVKGYTWKDILRPTNCKDPKHGYTKIRLRPLEEL